MHKCEQIKYSHIHWTKYSRFYPWSNSYSIDHASIQICIDQVLTYSLMKQLSFVPIKYSCLSIKYSNVYRSSSHIYVDHELTIVLMKKFSSVLINYSHTFPSSTRVSIMYIDQVLTWVSIKHSYLSILCINQVFTCIDQEFIFISTKQLSSVSIKYSYANQVRAIVVYWWITQVCIHIIIILVDGKNKSRSPMLPVIIIVNIPVNQVKPLSIFWKPFSETLYNYIHSNHTSSET